MSITALPLVIDVDGFQRRAWTFEYKETNYYIQESSEAYHVLKQTDSKWLPLAEKETQQIVTAFEAERGADRSGLKD